MESWRRTQIELDAQTDIYELCVKVNRSVIRVLNQRKPNRDGGFIVEERFKYRTKYSGDEYEYYVNEILYKTPHLVLLLLVGADLEITDTQIIVRILDSILED